MWHRAHGPVIGLLATIATACGGGDGGNGTTAPVPRFTGGPTSPLAGVFPTALATGYFDGDAERDLFVPGLLGLGQGSLEWGAGLFVGGAGGRFTPRAPVTAGLPKPFEVVHAISGHFRLGAHMDVVVVSGTEYGALLGNGDGTFEPATWFAPTFPGGLLAIDAARYDADGNFNDDFVVGTAQGTVAVFLGDGAGGFQLSDDFAVSPGSFILDVFVTDMDGDGLEDVVALDEDARVTVLFGDGAGSFALGPSISTGLPGDSAGILVGDFDASQGLDLAVLRGPFPTPTPHVQVMVVTGDGTGGFGIIDGTVDLPEAALPLGVGDVRGALVWMGDGVSRFVVAAGEGGPGGRRSLYLVRTDDAGLPTAERIPHPGSVYGFRAVDVNGDLLTDLVVVTEGQDVLDFSLQVLFATPP